MEGSRKFTPSPSAQWVSSPSLWGGQHELPAQKVNSVSVAVLAHCGSSSVFCC